MIGDDAGILTPRRVAEVLRTCVEQLIDASGLDLDAAQNTDPVRSLREMMEFIKNAKPRSGSAMMTYAWYRSTPLAVFSGKAAMHLVREGRAGFPLWLSKLTEERLYAICDAKGSNAVKLHQNQGRGYKHDYWPHDEECGGYSIDGFAGGVRTARYVA